MKLRHIIPLLVLSGYCIACTQTNNTAAEPKAIKLDNMGVPLGTLGFGVGSYLTIEGVKAKRDRPPLSPGFFVVDTVNGRRLAEPVTIELETTNDWTTNDLFGGGRFVFKGYESLEMVGTPPGYFEAAEGSGQKDSMPVQLGWHLRFYFVVRSSRITYPGLTAEHAGRLAQRLANDKLNQLYDRPKNFGGAPPARFVGGRWIWDAGVLGNHGYSYAKVELASDGSTNSVEAKYVAGGLP